eukprot:3064918-Prymnesium_polylepis.1
MASAAGGFTDQRRAHVSLIYIGSAHRQYGLWPMMRPAAVSGAMRALRCLWHGVRVDERTVR